MITKFEKYNEGIKHLLVGPNNEELWSNFMDSQKGLLKSIPTSPEDFFNQMKEDCVEIERNEHSIFYGKNNIILFQHILEWKDLYVSTKYIWSRFQKIYGLNTIEISKLIKSQLVNDTKWKGLNPYHGSEWFA